nr:DUF4157 domain-containing protein [Halohasta salina]
MRIPDESTLQRLEQTERTYGRETHDWIAEGMPAEIMGKPRDMEAFRQRQADRPPEVPTNVERQNRRSVLRSEQAAAETGSAGETGVPDAVREVISSTGRSLDASIQRAMEDRMGDSLGDVRIHTGPQAAAACESINARAFTVGNHVAFNAGEYDPESPEGQHVLAHELAHVRQQTQGAVSMLSQEDVELEVDPDPQLEREAEETAQRVMTGGELGIQRLAETEVYIQRATDTDQQSEPPTTLTAVAERVEEMQEQIDDNTQMAGKALGKAVALEQNDGLLEGSAESGFFEMIKKGSEMMLTSTVAAGGGSAAGLSPEMVLGIAGGSAVAQFLAQSASGAFGEEAREYVEKLDLDVDTITSILEGQETGNGADPFNGAES